MPPTGRSTETGGRGTASMSKPAASLATESSLNRSNVTRPFWLIAALASRGDWGQGLEAVCPRVRLPPSPARAPTLAKGGVVGSHCEHRELHGYLERGGTSLGNSVFDVSLPILMGVHAALACTRGDLIALGPLRRQPPSRRSAGDRIVRPSPALLPNRPSALYFESRMWLSGSNTPKQRDIMRLMHSSPTVCHVCVRRLP